MVSSWSWTTRPDLFGIYDPLKDVVGCEGVFPTTCVDTCFMNVEKVQGHVLHGVLFEEPQEYELLAPFIQATGSLTDDPGDVFVLLAS